MTTFKNKQSAELKSKEINKSKGFRIYFPTYIGESMYKLDGVPCAGWYIQNRETNKFY